MFVSELVYLLPETWGLEVVEVGQHCCCKFFVSTIYQLLQIFCHPLLLFFGYE